MLNNFSPESIRSIQEHIDSGFLTILQEDDDVGGLEVMNKSGAFVPVHPCPGTPFVNLGDFTQVFHRYFIYFISRLS